MTDIDIDHADNIPYRATRKYAITIISKDPDSELPDELLKGTPLCRLDRTYVADNLNHWVFDLFF